MRHRRFHQPTAVGLLGVLLGLAAPAVAAAATNQAYSGQFTTGSANTSTGLTFSTSSSDEANTANNRQPLAVRQYDVALPAGAVIDTQAAPQCAATDDQMRGNPDGA